MQTLSRRGRVSDGGQMTFPFLKVTKFPNDVLFFHRISLHKQHRIQADDQVIKPICKGALLWEKAVRFICIGPTFSCFQTGIHIFLFTDVFIK